MDNIRQNPSDDVQYYSALPKFQFEDYVKNFLQEIAPMEQKEPNKYIIVIYNGQTYRSKTVIPVADIHSVELVEAVENSDTQNFVRISYGNDYRSRIDNPEQMQSVLNQLREVGLWPKDES